MEQTFAEILVERLFQALISGERPQAREIIDEATEEGLSGEAVAMQVVWPTMQLVDRLFRADQLSMLSHHYATRLIRSLVNRLQTDYTQHESRHRTVCVFSGPSETEELAGQLISDLAESSGFDVYFAGGGIAADEILSEIAERRADVLLMFASAPSDAPHIRQIIDTIHDVNACPKLQIMVGGGVFQRADGLAEEIGADLWGHEPADVLEKLIHEQERRATDDQRTVGRNRRMTKAA